MHTQRICLGLIPLIGVGLTSLALAGSTRTLNVALATDSSVPKGAESFDCSRPAGQRAHVQALGEALNKNGELVLSSNQATFLSHVSGGTTQSLTLHDEDPNLIANPITQHRAKLQAHLIDPSTHSESTTDYASEGVSCTWTNQNATPHITLNTALSQTGSCQNRTYWAVSYGTTP